MDATDKFIKHFHQDALSCFAIAEREMELGHFNEAEDLFEKALSVFEFKNGKLDPKHARALIKLADVIEAQGRDSSSLRQIGEIILRLIPQS